MLVVEILYNFKVKIFGKDSLDKCLRLPRKKRSTACLLAEERRETRDNEIRYQHVKTVERVSQFVSSGLFSKDFLIALLKGDLDTVALDFELLAGGYLLGKLSNKLLAMGETLLSDEKIVVDENLKLEDKLASRVLFSDEILTAGKRRFLGKTMRLISPLVAKGTTIYIAYNFVKELNAYKSGNKQVLPNLVLDGTIVSVEGAEAVIEGSEFLGLITGISTFTGPIGEGIIALLWLGTEGYYAEEQVDAIKKHVHLSRKEQFIQGLRAFFQLSPSDYLEAKANNNQLVESAIRFLTEHTDIKRYIFSAWSTTTLHEENRVFLDRKVNITLSDNMPDDPQVGNLICLSGRLTDQLTDMDVLKSYILFENQRAKTSIYLCEKAIGVEYLVNRTGELTLIGLDQGTDTARVISDFPSIFFVNNGKKDYKADSALFIVPNLGEKPCASSELFQLKTQYASIE